MLDRQHASAELDAALRRAPVVLLTGPRQAGKSTLARQVVRPEPSHHFDLEDPRDLARLGDPTLSLPSLADTVVIDEAQRSPELFPVLRVLVDEDRRPGRFLVLGSASPELVGLASESLAGRVTFLHLEGFTLADTGAEALDQRWERGGLPPSYLARDTETSCRWRDDYITTFLERDLNELGFRMPSPTMRRFWTMIAHYHGQTWNASALAQSLDLSARTINRYLDALEQALVVRRLQPWFANLGKRQVKAPKVYVADSGLLHRLLGIADQTGLLSHPALGASWEGFVIGQLLAVDGVGDPWFWSTHQGAELDLLATVNGRRVGFEIKRTDRPRLTKSLAIAREDLQLDAAYVVHAGEHRFDLAEGVTALPARALASPDGVFVG